MSPRVSIPYGMMALSVRMETLYQNGMDVLIKVVFEYVVQRTICLATIWLGME